MKSAPLWVPFGTARKEPKGGSGAKIRFGFGLTPSLTGFSPLRTPITGDAVSVWLFYDRREVIRIDSTFVSAAAYLVPHLSASAPATRLTRRMRVKDGRFYCGE